MRFYTVHLRRRGLDPERDFILVKEGFSWPAFLFGLLWCLWHRMWLAAFGVAAAALAAGLATAAAGLHPNGQAAAAAGLMVLLGLLGNDLRRWSLARAGFAAAAVVAERDRAAAELRFLSENPRLAAGMLP
jgi:hypothetical protein